MENGKLIVEVPADHSFEAFRAFFKVNVFGGSRGTGTPTKVYIIYGTVAVVAILGLFFTPYQDIFTWLMFLSVFMPVFMLSMLLQTRSIYKRQQAVHDAQNTYLFYEDDILVKTVQAGQEMQAKIPYEGLQKAVETAEFIYIFIVRSNALIINKAQFVIGTPQDLQTLLQKKLGRKYVFNAGSYTTLAK